MALTISTSNVAMDGTNKAYSIPAHANMVVFKAVGGAISLRTAVGATTGFQLGANEELRLESRSFANKALWFNGANPAVLHVFEVTGGMEGAVGTEL